MFVQVIPIENAIGWMSMKTCKHGLIAFHYLTSLFSVEIKMNLPVVNTMMKCTVYRLCACFVAERR
jgi:hypothetical protein